MARQSLEPWIGLETAQPRDLGPKGLPPETQGLKGSFYGSCRYLLRVVLAGVDGAEGDVLDAVVLTAIIDLNIGYLDITQSLAWRHATYDQGPPDGYRKPAPVTAVAARLGLPYETVRRRVEGLIAHGRCLRRRRGLCPLINADWHRAASLANFMAVRTLLTDLRRRVPSVDWPDMGLLDAQGEPPLRLVNRRCGAYAVDALAALAELAGGYDDALTYMGIVEASGRAPKEVWPMLRTSPLARSLAAPVPSVRRRVGRLVDRGLITRRGAGFTARPQPQSETMVMALALANLERLHTLFSEIAVGGNPHNPGS